MRTEVTRVVGLLTTPRVPLALWTVGPALGTGCVPAAGAVPPGFGDAAALAAAHSEAAAIEAARGVSMCRFRARLLAMRSSAPAARSLHLMAA
jgi:hypothetical protein